MDSDKLSEKVNPETTALFIIDMQRDYCCEGGILDKMGFDRFRVYFTGRNLLTITEYEGLDPELSSDREIPLQKEFIFGLSLGF